MQCAEPAIQVDYRTWLSDVRATLASMNMEMETWQRNWAYDFHNEYNAGTSTREAALRAYDFWWEHLLAESWT